MNAAVPATDLRSIEVLATGLPLHHGAPQLAVDITKRSALTSASHACPNAATLTGAVLVRARTDKEREYAERVNWDRCRLVVVGVETGGRLSDEAVAFIDHLASARDAVGRACLRSHAEELSHSLWFLRPRALVVWRVPHLTWLACRVDVYPFSSPPPKNSQKHCFIVVLDASKRTEVGEQ